MGGLQARLLVRVLSNLFRRLFFSKASTCCTKAAVSPFSGDLAPRTVANIKRRLERLGYRVVLEPNAQAT